MSGGNAPIEFSGVLRRASFARDAISLFFLPWLFDATPDSRPVLHVRMRKPALQPSDFETLLNEGVEVAVYSDRIDVWREADHGQFAWAVEILSCEWAAYEFGDYAARIAELDQVCERQDNDLRAVRAKVDGALKLSYELIRRAEIKGDVSSDMRARQDEVIRVLERITSMLEDRDV